MEKFIINVPAEIEVGPYTYFVRKGKEMLSECGEGCAYRKGSFGGVMCTAFKEKLLQFDVKGYLFTPRCPKCFAATEYKEPTEETGETSFARRSFLPEKKIANYLKDKYKIEVDEDYYDFVLKVVEEKLTPEEEKEFESKYGFDLKKAYEGLFDGDSVLFNFAIIDGK